MPGQSVSVWKQTPKTTSLANLTPRAGSERAFARAKLEAGYFLVPNGPSSFSMAPSLS